jgi:hypothetical protein
MDLMDRAAGGGRVGGIIVYPNSTVGIDMHADGASVGSFIVHFRYHW